MGLITKILDFVGRVDVAFKIMVGLGLGVALVVGTAAAIWQAFHSLDIARQIIFAIGLFVLTTTAIYGMFYFASWWRRGRHIEAAVYEDMRQDSVMLHSEIQQQKGALGRYLMLTSKYVEAEGLDDAESPHMLLVFHFFNASWFRCEIKQQPEGLVSCLGIELVTHPTIDGAFPIKFGRNESVQVALKQPLLPVVADKLRNLEVVRCALNNISVWLDAKPFGRSEPMRIRLPLPEVARMKLTRPSPDTQDAQLEVTA